MDTKDPTEIVPIPIVSDETGTTAISRGLAIGTRTFSSFRNHLFRLYFVAFLCQTSAMNMQFIARSLLIYRITGSATVLGLMSLTYALPMLLFSYFGGFLADRYSKRNIMIVGQLAGACLAIGIAVAIHIGYLGTEQGDSWWLLMLASAIQGSVVAISIPAQQSYVAELVPNKQVQNAVALNSMGVNAMRMIGPAIAGFVIEFSGFNTIYFVTGGLYAIGALFLFGLPLAKKRVRHIGSAMHGLQGGIRYLRKDVTIMLILGGSLLVFMLGMPYFSMIPVFADDVLKVGASGMGLLLTINGVGAIFGSLVMAWLPSKNRGAIFILAICLMSIAIVVFAFTVSWYLSLFLMMVIGAGTALYSTTANSLLLHYTQQEYCGRVMSIYMMQIGFISLGATVAGIIADSIGIQWAIGGLAIALVTLSVTSFFVVGRVRRLQ